MKDLSLELSRGLNAVVSTYAQELGVLHHSGRFTPLFREKSYPAIDGFVAKPYLPATLIRTVVDVLGR